MLSNLPSGDWKAWSISTNIPFWGIGIAPILSPCYCERPRPLRRLRLEAALRFSPACYCEITPRTPFVGV